MLQAFGAWSKARNDAQKKKDTYTKLSAQPNKSAKAAKAKTELEAVSAFG